MFKLALAVAISLCGLPAAAAPPAPAAAEDDAQVRFLVLLEGGVGGGARAQEHLDRLLAVAARHSGWSSASSLYTTSRERAEAYVAAERPQLALFSLGAYLALDAAHDLKVVGSARAASAGGQRYFVVARAGEGLAACKGERLASNHLDDRRFIDRVVFAGAARLDDFEVQPTRRPVQTLKAVIRGDATCALIDDAQRATLPNIEGGDGLVTLWSSAELPPMPIVAFASGAPEVARAFAAALPKICAGDDREVCTNIGVEALDPASDADYVEVVRAYGAREVARP